MAMKKARLLTVFAMLLLLTCCDKPETVVVNIVHPDGSVTRRVEMRSSSRINLELSRVPVDSTWMINEYVDVADEGDTTFVLTAEKLFMDVSAINEEYLNDDGVNSFIGRRTDFKRSFRWFTTHYRFVERFDKIMNGGVPLTDYLTPDEMDFLVMPETISDLLLSGADSLEYQSLSARLDSVMFEWFRQGLISVFFDAATSLFEAEGTSPEIVEEFGSKKAELVDIYFFDAEVDSVFADVFGPFMESGYGNIIDSAMMVVTNGIDWYWNVKSYTLKTILPGRLKSGNGCIAPVGEVSWQVRGELFLFDDFEFWAESYRHNLWTYIVTCVLLTIVPLLMLRKLRRRRG